MQEVEQRRSSCRGVDAVVDPALQFIELADLLQKNKGGGVDVRRQFGDFLTQSGQAVMMFGVG